MSFFYDLNKKLDSIRATPEVTHQQLNERDMGKHNNGKTTGFKAVADKAAKEYGSKAAGERVAGAVKAKMAKAGKLEEESGEWSKIPVGVIDGPGGYEGGQQRIKDYESGKIDKNSKPLPPAGNKPRPAPKDNGMGRIVQGTWQADPKGKVPAPSGDPEGVPESGAPMTAKQTSFAKLAPPANKITFADKIAGAKKEVDEMLGDVAAEAMRGALSGGQKKLDKNHNGKLDANDFAMLRKGAKKGHSGEMDEAMPPRGKMTPSGKMTPKKFKAVFNGPLDWPRIVKFKDRLMGQGMEPEEAEQEAAERLGFEYEEVLDYLDLMNSTNEENDFTAHQRPAVTQPRVGSTERGHKHDIKHTATGRMVTRRTDDQGISVGGETDDEGNKKEKRTKAGRPDGTGKKIGAKGPSGNSKLMTKVDEVDIRDQGEYDQEGDMAKNDIKTIVRHAQALSKVLGDDDNLPEWVQSKLAKIEGMMISVDEYMQNQDSDDGEEPIAEEPRSKNQAVAARIARGVQKGTAKAKSGSASAEMAKMQPKELNKFAKGSTKGLPKKVSKKKEVDENSEEGRLTTTRTGPGQTSTSSSTGRISATVDKGQVTVKPAKSSGISYGQGIYDSMNHELEQMIAESMNISMSDSTEGNKSLTITATDDDAMKLGMLLKNAGLGGGDAHGEDFANQLQHDEHNHPGAAFGGEEVCDTCGMQDCGCGDVQEAVDENAPDWPTNTEQANNNFGYAGGLNKPKTDVAGNGQSTVPVVATRPHNEDDDMRRMMEMAGIKQAELKPWEQTMKEDAAEEQLSEIGDTPAGRAVLQKYQDKAGNQVDAHWQQVHDKSHLPTDPKMAKRNAGTVAAGNRTHGFGIAKNQQDKVTGRFKYRDAVGLSHVYQKNDPLEQGVAEEEVQEDFLESIQRMREIAGIREAKKPDFLDMDKDGNKKEPMSNAVKDKEEKKVDESIFALTNQWKAYKG